MTITTTLRPVLSTVSRLPKLSAHVAVSTLTLCTLFATPAQAGNNNDESHENIDHTFVNDYSGGYTWKTKTASWRRSVSREQIESAVADVVVGLTLGHTELHRQDGLGRAAALVVRASDRP